MRLAVADEDAAVGIDIDAMGTGHFTLEGISIAAVAFLAIARDEMNEACFRFKKTDGMAFAIREPSVAFSINGDTFWAAKRGFFSWATVAGEAFFARASNVMDGAGGEIKFKDLIALAGAEPEVACLVEVQ